MTTKESMFIMKYDNEKHCHNEVNGIYFYGLWNEFLPKVIAHQEIHNLWNDGVIELENTKFTNEEYKVYAIEVKIKLFPDRKFWKTNIQQVLEWFIEKGAVLSWCGAEDSSPNPIVFDPENSDSNVYAAFTDKTGFYYNAELDEEIEYLNNDQLQIINSLLSK